jgi:hypothetical protein
MLVLVAATMDGSSGRKLMSVARKENERAAQ